MYLKFINKLRAHNGYWTYLTEKNGNYRSGKCNHDRYIIASGRTNWTSLNANIQNWL